MSLCNECRFFVLDGYKEVDGKGICRCHAPGSGPTASAQSVTVRDEQHARAVWPIVEGGAVACGDFKVIPG